MVMAGLKAGRGAARRRFWLAMVGFSMALALMPFSYKVERRLETAAHIKGGESEKAVEALVPVLRAKADWMEGQLKGQYPNIKLEITGAMPLTFDLRKVSADDVRHAEERAMPVTLLLLLLAFGSLVAAVLPLGIGVLSISMALGAAGLLARYLHLSILVPNLATMLGLGLGIDYALLIVSRFREALA